ncbi:MAG: carboxypeptidase regulatory-like domain-containing protein [Gammaproteobacteria bacterium]|nr:carboxypeptidase regulatory-like domain-containing protein [Gammaproteobacteria bacterium]
MRSVGSWRRLAVAVFTLAVTTSSPADVAVSGRVLDLNGEPLKQAMVTVEPGPAKVGIAAVTVFTDDTGAFRFPGTIANVSAGKLPVRASKLGYRQSDVLSEATGDGVALTILLAPSAEQAGIAPASAWLRQIPSQEDTAKIIMNCVGCHQTPGPEVRHYARMVRDVPSADPAAVRQQSWSAMVKYMNFLSAEEFGRGLVGAAPIQPDRVYGVTDEDAVTKVLAKHLVGDFQSVQGYAWGAPLAVNGQTVIREYAVDLPNNVREALQLGDPPRLWAADVGSDNIVAIDIATGRQKIHTIPSPIPVGPHTLVAGQDGSLWVAPFFNGVVAHLDIAKDTWQVWPLKTPDGKDIGIHDLSFDVDHELVTDRKGRIWYSDITNNAVGYFDPGTGKAEIFRVPEHPGRPAQSAALYGLAVSGDRSRLWFSQLGIAAFGSFNIDTLQFETYETLPMLDAGPRRMAMSDNDILYIALYGAGQLLEYDTRARKTLGIYDLPDRASAPYSVTWDNLRKVAWVPTSNANVIYRFDPQSKSFTVLPLPREQGFLRMVGVDPATGFLATSYANISIPVHGPRMAVLIDPGDGVRQATPRGTERKGEQR